MSRKTPPPRNCPRCGSLLVAVHGIRQCPQSGCDYAFKRRKKHSEPQRGSA